jgi:hypothetical protein
MKNYALLFLVLMGYVNSANCQNFKKEAIEAKDTAYQCFIKLTDSTIIKFQHLKYKTPPLSYGYLEGDGEKLKYQAEDILCFQDEQGYWLRIVDPSLSRTPVVGRYSFDHFFAVRLVRGQIEIFRKYSNGEPGYFIKKGIAFQPLDKWGVGLKNMMKDNKKLYNDIDVSSDANMKDLVKIAQEYNKSK